MACGVSGLTIASTSSTLHHSQMQEPCTKNFKTRSRFPSRRCAIFSSHTYFKIDSNQLRFQSICRMMRSLKMMKAMCLTRKRTRTSNASKSSEQLDPRSLNLNVFCSCISFLWDCCCLQHACSCILSVNCGRSRWSMLCRTTP